jgi:two-component system chemotaxis response regulator CheB
METIQREVGFNVGQDEASCTVYGMPRSAAEAGILHRVVPLLQIPEPMMQLAHYKKAARASV